MTEVPEGTKTVSVESADLRTAIGEAANELGLKAGQVDHKIDLSHFRNTAGGSVPKRTVKIIAWDSGRTEEESADRMKKPAPREAREG